MKYMGSKAVLLGGKLGDSLLNEAVGKSDFVDLFAGSGAVAHFIAERVAVPVTTYDLQQYARVFSAAIIERKRPLSSDAMDAEWLHSARSLFRSCTPNTGWQSAKNLATKDVSTDRKLSGAGTNGFISRHYGGHYFSFQQAMALDALYASLPPTRSPRHSLSLAALIAAASSVAASPGHTAQPFQPTESLLPHIAIAWKRDVFQEVEAQLRSWAPRHALVAGKARVGDAIAAARRVPRGAFVFCDPPYSAAQYSRFYHVLEGISRGGWDSVHGAGRAPALYARARSEFSMKSAAPAAMKRLLDNLRSRDATVMITFPDADASNGLSGKDIESMASDDWHITVQHVASSHSTLGGTSRDSTRGGRRALNEAVITLRPRMLP